MSLRRLSGLDTAFLAAERPGNPLHMMGVVVLDPSTMPGGYSFAGVRQFFADRLPVLTPLRRRLVEVPGGLARPFWSEVGEVELDYHFRRVAAPQPGGMVELAEMARAMMERPLDRRFPLWEIQLVEGLEGGRIALLAKLSHAMMDGMAGIALLSHLVTDSPTLPPVHHKALATDEVPGPLGLVAEAVPWLARQPLRAARAGADTVRYLAAGRRRDAKRREATTAGPEVPRTWLNAALSPYRDVAFCSLRLADLKAVGHALDGTLNDVLLTIVGGALREYALDRGELPELPMVASVPIALRAEADDRANAVTAASVGLATDLDDPIARFEAIRAATSVRKKERGASLGESLAAWVDVPPPLVFSLVADAYLELDLAHRMTPICNLVVSSVPGPPGDLHLAGARLERLYPLGPIITGMALNVTAISAGDALHVGLVGCRKVVPGLSELADALPRALADLADARAA